MFRCSSVFISNYFKEAQIRTESGLEKLQHIITEILTKTHRDICSSSPENVQTIELLRRITEIALSRRRGGGLRRESSPRYFQFLFCQCCVAHCVPGFLGNFLSLSRPEKVFICRLYQIQRKHCGAQQKENR